MLHLISKIKVKSKTVNKLSVSFMDESISDYVIIITEKNNGSVISRRNITGDRDVYHCVFNYTGDEDQELEVHLEGSGSESIQIKYISDKEICPIYTDSHFNSNENSVTAAIATYPGRINVLPTAVDSLIDQVDHLFLYLNNYKKVPDFILSHKKREKITYILDTDSKKRAAAKFFWVTSVKGVHLTCDDDIYYPSDYVRRMVGALNKQPVKSIIAVHGAIYKNLVSDAIASRNYVFNFKNALKECQRVHLVGTGTLCFRTRTLNLEGFAQLWDFAASTDEWLACFSKRNDIHLTLINRPKNWMKSIEGMTHGLHEEKQADSSLKNKASSLLTENNPWNDISVSPENIKNDTPLTRKANKLFSSPKLFISDFIKKRVRLG